MLVNHRGRDVLMLLKEGRFDKTMAYIAPDSQAKWLPPLVPSQRPDRFVFTWCYQKKVFVEPYSEWLNKDIDIVPGPLHLTQGRSSSNFKPSRGCL